MNQFTSLYSAGKIGALELKNRVIMAAMGVPLAGAEGEVTDKMIAFYRARAEGGVGLVTTSFASISSDATFPLTLAIHDDKYIPGLRRMANAIHEAGAKVCVQLMHPGLLLLFLGWIAEGVTVKVPSITPRLKKDVPYHELSPADIDRYIELFAEAAQRARKSGADAVELHASNGCLVSTFLSPITNRRNDDYGGNAENRARFARRIVQRIKAVAGHDFPVIVRINMHDDMEGGVTPDEVVQQAQSIESAGADAINISSGLEYWTTSTIPCYLFPDGPMLPMAERVKRAVRIPVIAAGKIGVELADELVSAGKADYIAWGRPLLADPDLPNKAAQGRKDEVWECIYCNNCLNIDLDLYPGQCSVNPHVYREEGCPLPKAETPKKVMVIGGGLAGMRIALLLSQRGHKVSLYERNPELGGQWRNACATPAKKDYASLTEHLELGLRKEGVSVNTGVEITKETVQEAKPDAVVVATGASPAGLNVPGATGSNVVQGHDVIAGRVGVKGKAVVVGGRFIGMEVAISLAEQSKQVSLVTQAGLGEDGIRLEPMTFRSLARKLVELRVPLYLHSRVIEITDRAVVMTLGEDIFSLPADTVILAVGMKPENKLAKDLEGLVPELHTLGDCVKPKDAAAVAIQAGKLAGMI
jgi:2,4-dienoyl-CoA reductase-like NADH-dependent reductase (Old Yellow Enzyme family)/thioredoxin reductase